MIDLSSLRPQLCRFLDCLYSLLNKKQGIISSNWDTSGLIDSVISGLAKELEDDPDLASEPDQLIAAGFDEMAKHLDVKRFDWDSIRKSLAHSRYLLHYSSLSHQDAENLVSSSITEALEKWDPSREKNWSQPGLDLAIGILKIKVKEFFRKNNKNNNPNYNPVPPYKEPIRINGSKLTKLIDSWLASNLPLPTATAFLIHHVCGVPQSICGIVERWGLNTLPDAESHARGARKHWYDQDKRIREALGRYLLDNESEYE